MNLKFLKALFPGYVKMVGMGTAEELQEMLNERRRMQTLKNQQRTRLAQLKRKHAEGT